MNKYILILLVLITPTITFAEVPDIDKDGVSDGYDLFLQEGIRNGSIPEGIKYPIRNFLLDTLNKDLAQTVGPDTNTDSVLIEYDNSGKKIKDWKTKYEKKGHARGICEPPMINVTFDKTDSKGKPKELFKGLTTYPGYSSLQYQKVRFVADCDIAEYYGLESEDTIRAGLNNTVDIQLMDYAMYKIFRMFGVPSVDPVAFAKMSFKTDSSLYDKQNFNYLVLQRDNEQDDQIPFTKQFGMDKNIIEDGQMDKWTTHLENQGLPKENYLDVINVLDVKNDKIIDLDMDAETSIRYLILYRFLRTGDHDILHNEDYGKNLITGKWKPIIYGFDMSMYGCGIGSVSSISGDIEEASPEKRAELYRTYYRVGREIFGNPTNLYKMLLEVDRYPFEVDKTNLKRYLRLTFYEYSQYYTSPAFANDARQTYSKLGVVFPFSSTNEYVKEQQAFSDMCHAPLKENKNIVVSKPDIQIEQIMGANEDESSTRGRVKLSITAKEDTLLPEYDLLNIDFYSNVTGKRLYEGSPQMRYQYTNLEEAVGPYLLLKKGKTATIEYSFIGNPTYTECDKERCNRYFIRESQYAKAASLNLGKGYRPYTLADNKSNVISTGTHALPGADVERTSIPGKISKVEVPDIVEKGRYVDVNIQSTVGKINIDIYDRQGKYLVKNINTNYTLPVKGGQPNSKFRWLIPYDIESDMYTIKITDSSNPKVSSISNKFDVMDYTEKVTGSVTLVGSSTAEIVYVNQKENAIKISFTIKVTPYEDGYLDSLYVYAKRTLPQDELSQIADGLVFGYPVDDKGEYLRDRVALKKGKATDVKIVATMPTKHMFGGQYIFSLYAAMTTDSEMMSHPLSVTKTKLGNDLLIIGETSPYILSAVQDGSKLTLKGMKFNIGDNTVIINKIAKVVVAKESTKLEINLKDFGVKKGQDFIVVNTANGNSNLLYFDFKAYDPLVFRNLDGLKMANVFNSVLNIFSK